MAAAVGAVVAWVAANAAVATAIAMAVLSVAMSLMMKPKMPNQARGQAERKQVLRSSNAPVDWVYGHTVKSGLLAFAEEEIGGWQDEGTDPETNQGFVEWLHEVIVLAGHPVDRIGRIWFNDDEIQTYGSKAAYELLNNPQTANQFLLDSCPSWKPDMILKGLASLRVSMLFDQQKYSAGIPNVKVEVWGKQVFDPRDNQTKWSDNAALVLLDFIRHHPKMMVADNRIDWEAFKHAATICDEIVTDPKGKLEKRYTINGCIDLNERPASVIDDMLLSMSGELTWFGGLIGVQAGAYYGPATVTINSGDIISNIDITPESSSRERLNTVQGTFIDPEQMWVETDYPAVQVAEWLEEDGQEQSQDLKLRFVSSYYQAQRLANVLLRRNRLGQTLSFTMNLKGYAVMPGSYVRLKVPEIEIDREFRVVEWEHDPISGTVKLTVREDGIAVWDDCIGKPIDRPPLVNLPSGGPAVPSDIRFQVETIGEVVQGVLTWRNSAMTAYTNINIIRGSKIIYTAQEPRNIHRLGGLPAGNYTAELRAVGLAGGMSDKASIAFTVATPAAVTAVDIRAGNWDITLTPRIATTSTYGTEFEYFYYRTPLQASQVESTAQRLGYGAQLTHSGLATGTVHYYWIRAINAYGKGPLFALQASTTRDADSVLDVIAGEIGADALKDELKKEIEKIPTLVTPGQLDAAVNTETNERVTQDSALSQRIDTVSASTNTTAAGLQTEITARANADAALGQRIDTVTATAGGNAAAIQSEATARASADTAISQRIDTVQATVGQNTAAIQTTATAGTTSDGKTMNAMWSTKASINDIIGGFGLMAEQDPDGVTRIKFLVDADIFAVLGRNGDKRAPFVIKDGVVYMNKLLLDDAEIGNVIAKYIKVTNIDAATIVNSDFKGGNAGFGRGGPYGGWGEGWHTFIYADGSILTNRLYAAEGSFTGTVNANAGTFNNVTIAENCNVLGTVYANRIVGDVCRVASTMTSNETLTIPPFNRDRKLVIQGAGAVVTAAWSGQTYTCQGWIELFVNNSFVSRFEGSRVTSNPNLNAKDALTGFGYEASIPANQTFTVRFVARLNSDLGPYGGISVSSPLTAMAFIQ
jgi:hypothetical protein